MGLLGAGVPFAVDFLMIGETALAVLLAISYIMAKRHLGRQHHFAMISAFSIDMLIFKPLMFSRAVDGSNGYFPWDGTSVLPHLVASMLVALVGAFAILLGLRNVIRKDKKMFMPPKGKKHRIIGRIFLLLWFASYAIGVFIFNSNWM